MKIIILLILTIFIAGMDCKGNRGDQGEQGFLGGNGPLGPQGNDGATGNDGTNGVNGVTGATGATGPLGPQGNDGATGPRGERGPAGKDGETERERNAREKKEKEKREWEERERTISWETDGRHGGSTIHKKGLRAQIRVGFNIKEYFVRRGHGQYFSVKSLAPHDPIHVKINENGFLIEFNRIVRQ